jgi:sensor c-di-GMP phosphodiesterase-like protein
MTTVLREQAVAAVRISLAARGVEVPRACANAVRACDAAGVTMVQIGLELSEQERAEYRAYLVSMMGGAR